MVVFQCDMYVLISCTAIITKYKTLYVIMLWTKTFFVPQRVQPTKSFTTTQQLFKGLISLPCM